MKIEPLAPRHLRALRRRVGQLLPTAPQDHLLKGPSWAFIGPDGVFAAAGVLKQWEGVGRGWAVIPQDYVGAKLLLPLTRAVKRWLDANPGGYRRIEITVEYSHSAGLVWAKLLGFEPEGILRSYGLAGEDHILMSRVYNAVS